MNYIKYEPYVKISRNQAITSEVIQDLIRANDHNLQRYNYLQNYYEGVQDILTRTFDDTNKPNNKLVNNFASYITDVRTGYFTGIPIIYNSNNQQLLDEYNQIMHNNFDSDVNSELDKQSNIKGHCYQLLWINEQGELMFNWIPPEEVIMLYSNDVEQTPMYAIRYYREYDISGEWTNRELIFLYTDSVVIEYVNTYNKDDNDWEIVQTDMYPHNFKEVPIIEYVNNEERASSYQDVISLMDAYNLAESDSINDVQYFNDAYLMLKNMSSTDSENIRDMKNNRVLLVDGDGDAKWLIKNVNDTYIENIKNRLTKDIHKFSKTPNLVSDDFISNLSGTAIRYKVWGLEQDTSVKERKWEKSVKKKSRLVCYYLNLKNKDYDYNDITYVYTRNMPQNITEIGQLISQLSGIVSKETLYEQIPFIENPAEEVNRMGKEVEEATTLNNTGETLPDANTIEN